MHTAESEPAAELPRLGCDLDTTEGHPPTPAVTLGRPSFDTPWWSVAVEGVDRIEAGRTALALVEDDRSLYGPADEFEPAGGGPVAGDFAAVYDLVNAGEGLGPSCCQSRAASAADESEPTLVITGVTERGRDIIRLSDSFPRVTEVRELLETGDALELTRDDVELLAEQAAFWRAEFTRTYNQLWPMVEELREEVAELTSADDEDEGDDGEQAMEPVAKQCYAVPCGEPTEVRIDFEESTWEVDFDLNAEYVTMRYGAFLKGPYLAPGAAPVVTPPDMDAHEYWFTVAVRATNSATAIDLAREAVAAEHGITGDAIAVMQGARTVQDAGATAAQLGWVRRWAEQQLADTEAAGVRYREYMARLDQAGAAA